MLRTITGALALVCQTVPLSTTMASETVTYTYDAKGRLVKAEKSGTVNNGVKTEYTHDKAENRTRVKVTGAS